MQRANCSVPDAMFPSAPGIQGKEVNDSQSSWA